MRSIYAVPGRGERLIETFGPASLGSGWDVHGRDLVPPFETLRFDEQIEILRSDIANGFVSRDSVILGRSYGAYLLLHALADLAPYPGSILLLSPVLGPATVKSARGFISVFPPQPFKLTTLAKSRLFPVPRHLEIHTGAKDNGCDPSLAETFVSGLDHAELTLLEDMGHQFPEEVVRTILSAFLLRSHGG